MATAAVNKSQMIRDMLKAHRGKTPSQIAEILKGQGVYVTGTYVSNIKFNSRKKRRVLTVRGTARKTRGPRPAGAMFSSGIPAALEFIRAAGGLKAAKSALEMVEEIGNALR